jgi:magnesium transporter
MRSRDLAPDLPLEVMQGVFSSLPVEERERLRATMSYPEDAVGALVDFEMITIREEVAVEVVLRYLRRLDEMPNHTDQLFVVDRGERLLGLLSVSQPAGDRSRSGSIENYGRRFH